MKSNTALKIVVIALVVLFSGYLVYASWPPRGTPNPSQPNNSASTTETEDTEPVMCTMEAKLCPDGSYVGRSGPKCEFAACPVDNSTQGWKTYTDSKTGLSFQYPEKLSTTYITAADWPPQVRVLDKPYTCTEGGAATAAAGQTMKKIVNGTEYCVTLESEGAAGSVFMQYTYTFALASKTAVATFSLREVQCGNYDDMQKSECETERNSFTIDSVLTQMVQTIKTK